MMKKQKIAVLGPGSWGTALAQVLKRQRTRGSYLGKYP